MPYRFIETSCLAMNHPKGGRASWKAKNPQRYWIVVDPLGWVKGLHLVSPSRLSTWVLLLTQTRREMIHPARGQETESQLGSTWRRLIDSGVGNGELSCLVDRRCKAGQLIRWNRLRVA